MTILVNYIGFKLLQAANREKAEGCPTLYFSLSDPLVDQVAAHIEQAQLLNPLWKKLHRGTDEDFGSEANRSLRESNRNDALSGYGPPPAGQSWDEYPFASTLEGLNPNRSVQLVPLAQNSEQGRRISEFYRVTRRKAGDCFYVEVTP